MQRLFDALVEMHSNRFKIDFVDQLKEVYNPK